MKKLILFVMVAATIGLLAGCGSEGVQPKPDNINGTWKLNQAHTKGKWIGQGGVANIAYAKSQTGDTWKKVYIDNPVKYGLTMYKENDYLVVQFNDSTYQKTQNGGAVKFLTRPDTLFGIPQPFNWYGHGVFRRNKGAYLATKMRFPFKCSEVSEYHPQNNWKVYNTTSNQQDTLKVFVFTDISGALQTAQDVMGCN